MVRKGWREREARRSLYTRPGEGWEPSADLAVRKEKKEVQLGVLSPATRADKLTSTLTSFHALQPLNGLFITCLSLPTTDFP